MEYLLIFKAVLTSILSGTGIGVMAYLSKAQKGEKFERMKLAKTGFIGAVVGVIMHLTGQVMDASNFQVYIAANAGIIYMLDKVWSFIVNAIKARFNGLPPILLVMMLCISLMSSGCASMGGNIVTPETPEEKLAYAEATLTGLTVAAVQLNNAKLISLEKAKEIEVIITKAEFALRLGRIALNGKDAKTALDQLTIIQELLLTLNSFVESKRNDYLSIPLPPIPVEGEPTQIGGDVS